MALVSSLSVLPTLADDLSELEIKLQDSVIAEDSYLTEIASHLITAGGKRVRPGFTIASSGIQTIKALPASNDVLMGGVAVELVHLGSLYHDDVMDEAEMRRTVPSVNAIWGNLTAILAGDFLLARASGIAASLGTEVAELLAETIGELCEGQILELQSTFKLDRNESGYERSISGKTASLLATACRIGGLTADLSRENIDVLTSFGHSYGMAFQIVDDILDLVATDEQLGKPSGNDLMEGVYTLPVIFAFSSGNGEALKELLGKEISVEERDQARNLIRTSGGVSEALARARLWTDKASAALNDLPPSEATEALQAATTHLIQRAATPIIN
ncbi:MAG: polyprenyl synthetase family protein [Actinomycetota bacterium]